MPEGEGLGAEGAGGCLCHGDRGPQQVESLSRLAGTAVESADVGAISRGGLTANSEGPSSGAIACAPELEVLESGNAGGWASESLFGPAGCIKAAPFSGRKRRPELTPTQRAIGLLSRREHSQKELKRKLACKGVEAGEIQRAVETLSNAGWQDDARFAVSLARMRANTGHGPIRIRAELGTHGLDADAVRAALEAVEHEFDWRALARDLVRRRFSGSRHAEPVRKRKAADLLIRRGFDMDTVRDATRFDPEEI